MGRQRRPHLPGAVFHLTARTLRWAELFDAPMKSAAIEALARSVPGSRARLLAVAIMPNHLHLVVQQGERPLSALMQPLLRRLAHLLQRHHGIKGPIFWRPYADAACFDPEHARNAIAYTHLNPVRAGLCEQPGEYAWTSHALYSGDRIPTTAKPTGRVASLLATTRTLRRLIDPGIALPLFGSTSGRRLEELRTDYRHYCEWRLAADQDIAPEGGGDRPLTSLAPPPSALPWSHDYGPLFHSPARSGDAAPDAPEKRYIPTLAGIADATLTRLAPDVPLEAVKGRFGGRRMARIRKHLVIAMHVAGFRNVEIAWFLQLSESAVSKIVCARRNGC